MNVKELVLELERLQNSEGLPFDAANIQLSVIGDIYPRTLIGVRWVREFTCFELVFEGDSDD